MSAAEFLRWREFYKLFPFDDYHHFYRPAAMITKAVYEAGERKVDLNDLLEFLSPDRSQELSDADARTLRAFGFKRKGG
jgi:hypothetical protein